MLRDPDPAIRFWAVYVLGESPQARAELLRLLDDHAIAPGWWSVAQEVRGVLRKTPSEEEVFQEELRRVLDNPEASAEDKRWAECYINTLPACSTPS